MYIKSPYKAQKELVACTLHTVKQTSVTDYVSLHGTVVENNRRELYPKYPSQIVDIHVSQGDHVAKGDILITLYADTDTDAVSVFSSELQNRINTANTGSLYPKTPSSAKTEPVEYAIISPMDGIVMDIYSKEGEYVSGIFPCISVSDLSDLGVKAEISEENSHLLSSDMTCTITIPSMGDAALAGHISSIAPYAAAASILEQSDDVSIAVKAEIHSPPIDLRPGFTANLKIQTGPTQECLLLPYRCLAQDSDGEYVLQPNEENILVRTPVLVGRELQDGVEILNGIDAQSVVVEYPEQYSAGAEVKLK